MELTARPLVPEVWPAFEDLFEDSPVCGRCWCMYWRIGGRLSEEAGRGDRQWRLARVDDVTVWSLTCFYARKAPRPIMRHHLKAK